ncbi:MAG: gamma-glutamyl-phosphate reductase, partial [Gammaproteobacteria bacterium]
MAVPRPLNIQAYMQEVGRRARAASFAMARAAPALKNAALTGIAETIERNQRALLEANGRDLAAGAGLDAALLDRLELN